MGIYKSATVVLDNPKMVEVYNLEYINNERRIGDTVNIAAWHRALDNYNNKLLGLPKGFKRTVDKDKDYPDNNPKTQFGVKKLPLHLVPPSATAYLSQAFKDGAGKYGPYNWREKKISSSVYYAACKRHMDAWWDGEEVAEDSGVHHLAHAMACLAMILDTKDGDMLNDDRPPKGNFNHIVAEYASE